MSFAVWTTVAVLAVTILFALFQWNSAKTLKPSGSQYDIPETLIPAESLIDEMSSVTVEDIQALKPTDAMWTIGITAKSASVSEEATLRIMEFIPQSLKLSPEFLAALVLKAMVNPTAILEDSGADDGDELLPKVQRRPQVMSFLPTELIPHALIDAVAQKMEAYGVKITSYQQLKPEEMTEIIKKRRADILKEDKEMRQKLKEKAVSEKVEYQPQPLRGCFTCKTEITGKASQCSACKAIIYCSADCAKKDWPMHKQMCASFKGNMTRLSQWSLHSFPFSFYPEDKPFCSYNLVSLLVNHGLHNVGIFRRLCHCYQSTAFGELGAERVAQLDAASVTDPWDKFETLGLSKEWFPLSKPIDSATRITGWKELYEAKGVAMEDVGCLVFDHVMTVWHLLNKYVMDGVLVKDGRKTITVHLLGAEVEADYLPAFELLVGLLPPKTRLAIHMIGPEISPRLEPSHRGMYFVSSERGTEVLLSLTSSLYTPEHYSGSVMTTESGGTLPFGKGSPDIVMILNGNLLGYETWVESIKLLVDEGQKTLVTEPMEQGIEAIARNLPALGAQLSIEPLPNPFKHPVFQFKKDTNLPGWSNAFVTGFGF